MKVQVGRFVCQITMKTIRVSLTLSRARILACLPTTPELSDSPNPALTCSECKAHLAEPWGALLPIPDPEGEESSPRPQISSRDKPTSRTVARWRLLRSRTSSLECGLQESRQSWWLGATGTGPFSGDFWNADSSCIHLKCIYLSLLVPAWQTPNHECTRGPLQPSDITAVPTTRTYDPKGRTSLCCVILPLTAPHASLVVQQVHTKGMWHGFPTHFK